MYEEAAYWHTITDFEKICEEAGVGQVWNDLAPYIRLMIVKHIERVERGNE